MPAVPLRDGAWGDGPVPEFLLACQSACIRASAPSEQVARSSRAQVPGFCPRTRPVSARCTVVSDSPARSASCSCVSPSAWRPAVRAADRARSAGPGVREIAPVSALQARARVDVDFRPQAEDLTTSERRWLTLTIENDRCGAADSGMIAQGNGFGLIGMRERVIALGGQLDIIDLGDRGFKIHAMIPFEIRARLAQ